jgi:hypothetical protein
MKNMIQGIAAMRPRTARRAQAHQPVDGAVVLRQREQVGDADQREEEFGGEAGHDGLGLHAGDQRADQEGPDEGDDAHVDGQGGAEDEHRYQGVDRDHVGGHCLSPAGGATRHAARASVWCSCQYRLR